jgi:thiopeptide-type bacteriocin biosynthesis protein
MKLKVLDILLCRTPVFSVKDDLEDRWQDLKILISQASPSFYKVIENLNFHELETADKKISFSIWKYFNRAQYRATPFGGFAAFTVLPLSMDSSPLVLDENLLRKHFVDWQQKDSYTNDFARVVKDSLWFQTNSTVYTVGNEIRFIRIKQGCFEMASVSGFPELNAIITLCKEKTSKQGIYDYMKSNYQLHVKSVDRLLEQLLNLQLILTELFPNITGQDYFERLNIERPVSTDMYTISERKLIKGCFNEKKIQEISGLIRFLQMNLPDTANSTLTNFRSAFLKKFEKNAVPLSVVMDPEIGIGYGNFGHHLKDQYLINVLETVGKNERPDLQIPFTKLHHFLLNSLIRGGDIRLEEFDEAKTEIALPLPNTFSVMYRFYGDQPVIENMGGCTANALIGRFTIASPELEKLGKQIASLEEKANPGIIFFDIAYQAERQVDNVNRRKQLYSKELPILTWSCDPSPIDFDDILVGISNSEVILWSKKFGKRMVPRIPSAYNYTRSDLAVYRFLCELQHQGIKSDLSFKIQQFFPHLDHYPRVVYKSVIVSPAIWRVPKGILQIIAASQPLEPLTALSNWLKENRINFRFKAGFADQTLCFDPAIEADKIAFLNFCRQNLPKAIYISESLIPNKLDVSDDKGKAYLAEYIVNYAHEGNVYSGSQHLINYKQYNRSSNSISLPGGDWLYFEIYCHPSRSNAVLTIQIATFLKEGEQKIRKWFFIRYEDPKPHLRLRLQLKDTSQGYLFINRLNSLLEEDCLKGLISDIQIKTYFREVQRFGVTRITLVEIFFYTDSRLILSLLRKNHSPAYLYAITLRLMKRFLELCYEDITGQISFATNMANSFREELNMNPETFKKINQSFEKHKGTNIQISTVFGRLFGSCEKQFLKIMNCCDNNADRANMVGDLLHMHINRLFMSDQRTHEAILYHYLLKDLKTHRALSILKRECPTEL